MNFLRDLLVQTIYAPADAARTVIGLNLSRETAWMALMLAAILNTLAYFTNITLFPVPDEFWLPVIRAPFVYLIASFSLTTVMIFAIFWTGRVMGGTAYLPHMVALIAWIVTVQTLADAAFLVLFLFIPMLAGLFSLAAGLYGIWILINFITVAHNFPDKGKAVVTIVLALVGLIVGLSVFMSVLGVTAMGIS